MSKHLFKGRKSKGTLISMLSYRCHELPLSTMKQDKPLFFTRLTGLFLILVAAMILLEMRDLMAEKELWGYLPLWFYLTAYLGLLAIFYKLEFKKPPPPEDKSVIPEASNSVNNTRALIYSTATGILLGFGFPGYLPAPFLLLFAFVPLLVLQRELRLSHASNLQVFFHGFNAFFLYNVLTTYWVTNTAFGPGLFAVLVNTLLMCIPWMAFHFTSKASQSLALFALPAYWITFEWGHYHWDLNWPWLTLGNGLAEFPRFIQWYDITGALGGGLWIWICNLVFFDQSSDRLADFLWATPAGSPFHATAKRGRGWRWWSLLLVFGPMLYSLYTFNIRTDEVANTDKIRVASIQPNFEPHFEKFTVGRGDRLDTFVLLSEAAMNAYPELDYIVYPETSFDYVNEDAIMQSQDFKQLFSRLGNKGAKYLVTGYDGYHFFGPNEPRSKAVRTVNYRGRPTELEALNAAAQLDLKTQATQTYRKGVFVPGAENFPFRDYLGFALPLVEAAGGSVAGRGTQSERTPFVSSVAKIAPVICYESVFGGFFTDYIKEGAQAAFVMTNDGWWDNTAGFKQHLFMSSLRAIETRRAVVRSANMGACAFIDERGHIQSQTSYGEAGYLYGEMALNDELTFYVRNGDWLPLIMAIGSMLTLLLTLVITFLRRKKRRRKASA